MKTVFFRSPLRLSLAALLVGISSVSAQTVFHDGFSRGTAADAGYYRFGTAGTTLATDNARGVLMFNMSTGAENRSGVVKQFPNTTLGVGDTLIFSFTVASSFLANENNAFRYMIGHVAQNLRRDQASAAPISGGTHRRLIFAHPVSGEDGQISHVGGGDSLIHWGDAMATPLADALVRIGSSLVDRQVTLRIERTATGLSINGRIGTQTFNTDFTTNNSSDFTFNTLAFGLNNAGNYDFALSEVSVAVIRR